MQMSVLFVEDQTGSRTATVYAQASEGLTSLALWAGPTAPDLTC